MVDFGVRLSIGLRVVRSAPLRLGSRSLYDGGIVLQREFGVKGLARSRLQQQRAWSSGRDNHPTSHGIATPLPNHDTAAAPATTSNEPRTPYFFETGYALYAKRPSRPFPPPFLSLPATSFSDPLTTHSRSRDRRPFVNGKMIRGMTNGDDAVLAEENFLGVNDGVGAWATREGGHAALWSRLLLHFWASEVDSNLVSTASPNPIECLQRAYEHTVTATSSPTQWDGTSTVCGALLHTRFDTEQSKPILYVTNLGDCQIMVIRPRDQEVIYKTKEQWHWFDCPMQLGTNSLDRPRTHAVMDTVEIEEEDVVVAVTDGVTDNLWEHEILSNVLDSIHKWNGRAKGTPAPDEESSAESPMEYAADRLMNAARLVAEDPFGESPYMEKAIDEGLSIEGGKMDDISAVVAMCKKRKG